MIVPTIIRRLTPEGLEPVAYAAESLADAARFEPDDGVYTITNTHNTFQTLKLDAHLDRMEDSARREGIPLKLNRPALRAALRQMIAESGYGDARFRITVPRDAPDQLILSVEPFKPPPPEAYTRGIRCKTVSGSARHNPAAKTTDWMHDRLAIVRAFPAGISEGLLVNDRDELLEGLSSNFYAVVNRELRTAGEGVLPGIAQQIVFEVASTIIPVRKAPVRVADIPALDEAFITSSSRGIMPVVEIDGAQIGDGAPGAVTLALRAAYLAWVKAHLQML